MPTKDERRKALEDQLAALEDEPDEPKHRVSFWSGEGADAKGGEVPWELGEKIFGKWFPDLFGPEPAEPAGKGKGKGSRSSNSDPSSGESSSGEGGGSTPPGTVRFGRRVG